MVSVGMGWFPLDSLHRPNPYVPQSGLGSLGAFRAREGGPVSEICYPRFGSMLLVIVPIIFSLALFFYTKAQLTLRKRLNILAHSATQM